LELKVKTQLAGTVAPQSATAQTVARGVLLQEAKAIFSYLEKEDPALEAATDLIFRSQGPLIVSGIGKSGHIARKIASTFRSLGKPAAFLHAAEASHGDLGIIQDGSVVLVLSNSGETSELSDLLHYCRAHDIEMIGLTSREDSTLARVSTVAIAYGKVAEACVNGLAPTTSTTIALAIGDALAVATSVLLKTAPADFRQYHPGGKLGARLLSAADIMKTGDSLPLVQEDDDMTKVVVVMSEKSLGTAVVLDQDRVVGVITDGDMRRHISDLWECKARDIATRTPVWVSSDCLVSDAIDLMNAQGITACLVRSGAKDGEFLGLLHLHDCLAKRGA
jgi:arabinose-5-phosphate isomerase